MNRMARAILGIFFIAVIGVSAVSISQDLFKNIRKDMTENKLYTLEDGTKEILKGIQQPITMKLFYTKEAAVKSDIDNIRFFNNYYSYVLALLQEYETQAKGNVKLEVIDPRPYTDEEMAAVRYGLKRIPLSEDSNFIFGLVVQTQFGVTKTIDIFNPERQQLVEYDISYLIDTAITKQKKRLGVLSSLDLVGDTDYMAQMKRMQGQQAKPKWGIISHLEKQFEVSNIPADTDTIADIDLLLIVHPKNLPDTTLFAIDQFILKGGRAIVCVDPHCVSDPPDMTQRYGAEHDSSSNLAKLLNNWGLVMPANTFAGDSKLAVVGAVRPGQKPEKILGIMKLASAYDCFNPDSAISSQLGEVTVIFPGVLKIKETNSDEDAQKLTYKSLLSTSDQGNSWRVDNRFELMNPDYAKFMRQFRKGTEPVSMGYMVTGKFRSAFPEGIEVPDDSESAKTEDSPKTKKITGLTQAEDSCAVVVLADVDILSDMVAYQRSFFGLTAVGDNSTLIFNALEDLSGSSNLISIRSRGNFKRPFLKVDQLEADADEKTAKREEEVMAQITVFQQQLNEKLQALQGEGKGELINQTILEEKKEIEIKLKEEEKQLRDIKMEKREDVEALKRKMRNLCTLYGPGLTLAIAILLGIYRSIRRRRYISHASDS